MNDAHGLSERQRALLTRELERRRQAAVPPIRPRPVGEPPTLSLAQQRLWFLDRLAPGRSTYNATLTMHLEGPLDDASLRAALDLVVTRHEALRTVGVLVGDRPEGRLLDTGVRWTARAVDPADLTTALVDAAREPFDLSSDVMLRAWLFRVGQDDHVLLLVLHHIASDGWSRGVLFAELTEAYNAAVGGRRADLPELPVQYGDYATWQRAQQTSERLARTDAFWRRELEGANLVLDLPTDHPRTRSPDHLGTRVAMDGGPGSGDALRAIAREEGATYFMVTMAVAGLLLGALSGSDDVVLGSPVANRQQPELERLIGFFVNTVILRVRLDGDPDFRTLVRRCRSAALAALAHQDTPLERVVEVVNPKRVAGLNPLFQVNFRMQGVAPEPPRLTGLTVTRMFTDTGSARFDLALGLVDQPGAVRGYVEYPHQMFRSSTADALQRAFVQVVDDVVAEPERPCSLVQESVRNRFAEDRRTQSAFAGPARRSIRGRA